MRLSKLARVLGVTQREITIFITDELQQPAPSVHSRLGETLMDAILSRFDQTGEKISAYRASAEKVTEPEHIELPEEESVPETKSTTHLQGESFTEQEEMQLSDNHHTKDAEIIDEQSLAEDNPGPVPTVTTEETQDKTIYETTEDPEDNAQPLQEIEQVEKKSVVTQEFTGNGAPSTPAEDHEIKKKTSGVVAESTDPGPLAETASSVAGGDKPAGFVREEHGQTTAVDGPEEEDQSQQPGSPWQNHNYALLQEDEEGVFRARLGKLEGIKVLGKIELPEPKPKTEKKAEKAEKKERSSGSGNSKNRYKNRKPQTYQQKLAREEQKKERERKKLQASLKEKKKKHYHKKIETKAGQLKSTKTKRKKQDSNLTSKRREIPRGNLLQKLWGWLNGKYD